MSGQFEAHLTAAEEALKERRNAEAGIAFQAALASGGTGLECALSLLGLAVVSWRSHDDARALSQLDQAISCLPLDSAPDTRTADTFARICEQKAMILMRPPGRRYDLAIQVLDDALSRFLDRASAPEPRDPFARRLRRSIISVLRLKAGILGSDMRPGEEIACQDELIRRFEFVADPEIVRSVAWTMLFRAMDFRDVGREAEQMSAFDAIVARYGDYTEERIVEAVIMALLRKLEIHEKDENFAAALATAEEIIRRSAGQTDPMILYHAAEARLSKADALIALDRDDEGRALCDRIIADHTDQTVPSTAAARALLIKGNSYAESDIASAIACYDQAFEEYGESSDVSLMRQVGYALMNKGEALREAGRIDEAAAAFAQVVDRYGDTLDPILADVVAEARTRHGDSGRH